MTGSERDLLVLPEDMDFGSGEAELGVGDGGGERGGGGHWFTFC